ncbi:MAG: AbgT family transporter [Maricaulis sp.]|jgi:aminobenzoyl-glutamate transport protein|uniref:AbgT family transporter n=1 Tax=Maricaulis sp. TaxID=1486257 RepID=UPI001B1B4294|nr:AbgT family transporter [Maricaulis sp.]MBO6730973.1 AbgT family transporter [Maricaulis sp.]MBO6846957.1 AbgT family transporter [Maricaulis sp.]MBO6876316.1 AbgT family transporter [Maricaulis sp.]MDM7984552.1 AbgT family transporter [Maricaulis sp.]
MAESQSPAPKKNAFTRFLDGVEFLGNLLPHPVTLFAILALGIILLSGLFGWLGLAVEDPRPAGARGVADDGMIRAVSLLNADGFRRIWTSLTTNFTGFAPLGVVLVAMLGVGVAEKSGMLSAAVRGMVLGAPRHVVTVAIVFAGIVSNTASEVGYVVLIPLAGAIFYALGRHPLAGMAAAFAGVSGGYSANILIGTIDPLLAGITQEAARLIDPDYIVLPTANWYFMVASTFLITTVGSLVSIFIVEPKLGPYNPAQADDSVLDKRMMEKLSAEEKKGLFYAFLALLGVLGLMALTLIPEWGILRNPDTGDRFNSPFFRGFVVWILIFFVATGFAYGRGAGTMKDDRDIIDGMATGLSSLGLYIVLVFFAAQFVSFFGWTNIGAISAVSGANFLESTGMTGPLLFFLFILMCAIINLSLGSASAQWAVTAPIFVPMLMLIGYSPEVIQAAYRIGDSTTNIITPMMSYFGLILAWATRYKKDLGVGTMIAMMLPYSIFFILTWSVFFFVWAFGFDMPVGPGSPTYYPAQ